VRDPFLPDYDWVLGNFRGSALTVRVNEGRWVTSKSPLLARAGEEEGARKRTRLDTSFPNAGETFLAWKRHRGKVLVTMEEYLPQYGQVIKAFKSHWGRKVVMIVNVGVLGSARGCKVCKPPFGVKVNMILNLFCYPSERRLPQTYTIIIFWRH